MSGFEPRRIALTVASTLVDRLRSHDPALSRVKMGARVTLTIVASILALIGIHIAVVPLPPISYALAIVLSIEGGVAVRDRTPAEQLKTRAMGCATSLLCITLAALLESNRIVADVAFLCVILVATLARVYGQRGFAIGMFAFISYFIGAYLRPTFGELPLAALGPVLAVAFGHLIRTRLLADDWRRDLLTAMNAIETRVSRILLRLSALSQRGDVTYRDRLELRQMAEHLKDAVLMAEGLIPREPASASAAETDPATMISMAIFDVHLAAESAIVRSLDAPAPPVLLRALIDGDKDLAAKVAESTAAETGGEAMQQTARALLWLQRSSSTLAMITEKGGSTRFHDLADAPPQTIDEPDLSWRNPLVRAAIQITIASAVAMVFGLMLSRERWFWAVLTAFLVFNNTRSRGDAAIRAAQRSVGTLLGVAIGLAAATLLADQTPALVLLALVCVFLAFYFLQVSYALMSFFVTIVLCLVYGLLGELTLDVLLLRLEETLVGALAGAFVAFVIFPASTRSTVELALARWYDALGLLLDAVREGAGGYRLVELSNRLDASYRDLTVAARPLGSAWSLVTRPGPVRQTLAVFLAASYWARILARGAADAGNPRDPEITKAIDAAGYALDRARKGGADCFSAARRPHAAARSVLPSSGDGAVLGADMVANLLDRLYPPASERG